MGKWMKENNELREWKKVAIAAGLKLPKGPVTKPDYVLPPKINPATGKPIPSGQFRNIPIPTPSGSLGQLRNIPKGRFHDQKVYIEKYKKALEARTRARAAEKK